MSFSSRFSVPVQSATRFMLGLLMLLPAGVRAQSAPCLMGGNLDPGFGVVGRVTTPFGSSGAAALAVVLQPDGRMVAAGVAGISVRDFALARYNTDGSPDTAFDTDGQVTTDFGGNNDSITAVALQPDGKIVAAGVTFVGSVFDFALARYHADGSLDTSFGDGGRVQTDFGFGADGAQAIALQPDGKIVAAGFATAVRGGLEDFGLARYLTNGALDMTFGTGGKVMTAVSSSDESAQALALQPDGKIVAVGYARFGGQQDFALVRYLTNGLLDMTFNADGMVTTSLSPTHDRASAAVLQPDGRIVAAGFASTSSTADFALARYTAAGALDPTFDGDGQVTTDFGSKDDSAADVELQPDGKIVVVGNSIMGLRRDFAIARYDPNGMLDATFDTDGKVTTNFGLGDDSASALALQPDGKIVAVGNAVINGRQDFALARYGTCPPPTWISTVNRTETTVTITLNSFTGYTYQLQRAASLTPAAFLDTGSPQTGSTGNVLTFTDPEATGDTAFYGVVTTP